MINNEALMSDQPSTSRGRSIKQFLEKSDRSKRRQIKQLR